MAISFDSMRRRGTSKWDLTKKVCTVGFPGRMPAAASPAPACSHCCAVACRCPCVQIVLRAIKLYALGCFLNGGADLSNWRL